MCITYPFNDTNFTLWTVELLILQLYTIKQHLKRLKRLSAISWCTQIQLHTRYVLPDCIRHNQDNSECNFLPYKCIPTHIINSHLMQLMKLLVVTCLKATVLHFSHQAIRNPKAKQVKKRYKASSHPQRAWKLQTMRPSQSIRDGLCQTLHHRLTNNTEWMTCVLIVSVDWSESKIKL